MKLASVEHLPLSARTAIVSASDLQEFRFGVFKKQNKKQSFRILMAQSHQIEKPPRMIGMNFLSHLAFEATNWFETIFAHWSPGRSKPASQQITAVNCSQPEYAEQLYSVTTELKYMFECFCFVFLIFLLGSKIKHSAN